MSTRDTAPPGTQSEGTLARHVMDAAPGEATWAEAELYRRFAPRVRLYGLKHLRDRAAADDLAQQVMLTVLERLRGGEVRNPDEIGSFILGTSRMTAMSLRRTDQRRASIREQLERGDLDVAAICETAVDWRRVTPCLQQVRERERTILILTFYAERSAEEIGRALGMTPGAVRVARHRALESMRTCVEQREPA